VKGPATRWTAPLAACLLAAGATGLGCRFHMMRIDESRPLSPEVYRSIALGSDRRALLDRLGPPDQLTYTPTEVVYDYVSASHRATDLRLFLPTDALPGLNPSLLLGLTRWFFGPFREPEEFREPTTVRLSRVALDATTRFVPFAGGGDLLILRGRQLRRDRLRVVLDRASATVRRKALRLASGEYARESLPERALLQTH